MHCASGMAFEKPCPPGTYFNPQGHCGFDAKFHFVKFHLITFHLVKFHFVKFHLIKFHQIQFHLVKFP